MTYSDSLVVEAVHPHWRGQLRLSGTSDHVEREGYPARGTYDLQGDLLTVNWHGFPAEVFYRTAGIFIQGDLLKEAAKLEQMQAVRIGERPFAVSKVSVIIPRSDYEVSLRPRTSDVPTFLQVFQHTEYLSSNLPPSAQTIVDLGANIGLATVFFGLKYPQARLLSVEPETDNFLLMCENTRRLGERVQSLQGAVWIKDGSINLHTEAENGAALGAWGVQVGEHASHTGATTSCFKLSWLLRRADFAEVDILKIDIEGAELEVFSHEAEDWIRRIKLLIIETHDRFRSGTNEAVRRALAPLFQELPPSGENLFFRRIAD